MDDAWSGQSVYNASLAARADSLSALQNLGKPLSRIAPPPRVIPPESPIPGVLDMSLAVEPTRTKKCCKDAPPIERMSSEWYPIPAPIDARTKLAIVGAPSRMNGRDPVTYTR